MSAASRLRELLEQPGMLEAPGVVNRYMGRAAEVLGFDAIYMGGYVTAATRFALPDMGLVSSMQLVENAARIAEDVEIPLIVDLDDCGGTPLMIRQVVREAEGAGIAAFTIEDLDFTGGKHFPPEEGSEDHMDWSQDKCIPIDDAVDRLRLAIEARRNPDTVIIARTDSTRESLDEAIERGNRFAEAGADLVFLAHGEATHADKAVARLNIPLALFPSRLSGFTPEHRAMAESAGVKLYMNNGPVFAALHASWAALEEQKQTGTISPNYEDMLPLISDIVRHVEWAKAARPGVTK